MRRLVPAIVTIAVVLIAVAGILVNLVLGSEWSDAVPILRVLAVPMLLGAVIAVLVAYLRGAGKPKVVTQATLIQLAVLLIVAPPLLYYFAAVGMASSLAIAGAVVVAYMFRRIYITQ
jgi:PST family polysaccharide transporter